jgi:hypothetical protein
MASSGQALNEEFQCILCHLHLLTIHWATAIDYEYENILAWIACYKNRFLLLWTFIINYLDFFLEVLSSEGRN